MSTGCQIRVLLLDYGGVVADHYSQPHLDELARLLSVDAKRALELVSENTPHGRDFRLGLISLAEFCGAITQLSGQVVTDPEAVLLAWARTYVPNQAMLNLIGHLKNSRGLRVGLMLNEDHERMKYLRQSGISQHFDFLVASCEVGAIKPDPMIFQYALEVNKVTRDPREILYVDDRPKHVDAASKLGFHGRLFIGHGEFSLYITEALRT